MVKCKNCKRYDSLCHRHAEQFNLYESKYIRVGYTSGCKLNLKNGKCPEYKRKWWRLS